MRRFLPLFVVALIVIIIISLYWLGFRITYAPNLENNWTAIDAVGTWAGVLSPILLAIINATFAKKIEKTKHEIATSNKVLYEQKCINNIPLDNDLIHEKIIKYITVGITISTKEISNFTGLDIETVYNILIEMETNKKICRISNGNHADIFWKIYD